MASITSDEAEIGRQGHTGAPVLLGGTCCMAAACMGLPYHCCSRRHGVNHVGFQGFNRPLRRVRSGKSARSSPEGWGRDSARADRDPPPGGKLCGRAWVLLHSPCLQPASPTFHLFMPLAMLGDTWMRVQLAYGPVSPGAPHQRHWCVLDPPLSPSDSGSPTAAGADWRVWGCEGECIHQSSGGARRFDRRRPSRRSAV